MMRVEAKLEEMELALPEPVKPPPGVRLSFAWVRVRGDLAYVSGHGPLNLDGSPAGPFGKVGLEVSPEEGYQAARECAIQQLSMAKGVLGELSRIKRVVKVLGMVNCVPGFTDSPAVMHGFSELMHSVLGEAGVHARSAIGVQALPANVPIEVETIFEIS